MKRLSICLALICIILGLLTLQATPTGSSSNEFSSLVRIPFKGPAQIRLLMERNIDIVKISRKGYIDAVAYPKDMDFLLSLGYPITTLATSSMSLAPLALDDSLGLYHTFAEMESMLTALSLLYPTISQLDVIGYSHEGREIYLLKISDNAAVDETEPEVAIMGGHHARELMSVEIPLLFAEELLTNYGSDPTITNLVDTREIFFIPMINPDGHVYVQHNHSGSWWNWWRKNRRDNGDGSYGVDLNRNYGYEWGYDNIGSSPDPGTGLYRGPSAFSEPETQAIRDFCNSRDIVMSLSYHSYGELLLYPWGYYYGYTPDHDTYSALGDTLTASNGYFPGNSAMGAIYIVNGDSDDWFYGEDTTKKPIFAFTPEVNSNEEGGFGPPDTLITPTYDKLLPMNMLFLELADNPYRIIGPVAPTMNPVDESPLPSYVVNWSGNAPEDPNPVTGYDLVEYKNYYSVMDHADTLSPLWLFDGFTSGSRAYEGASSYYSNTGDELTSMLEMEAFYMVSPEQDTLSFWAWWDIEADWDYAYVEVTTNDGLIWEPIEGNITTSSDPNGSNRGHGITGTSSGWVEAIFPLTDYMGQGINIRISYITDALYYNEGFYADLINLVPSFESSSVIATALPDTFHTILPTEIGSFAYRVRASDADGDLSRWSNPVTHIVDEVVGATTHPTMTDWLGLNYPNPFNPQTFIPFYIGSSPGMNSTKHVSLVIYSVKGEAVVTLIDAPMTEGVYRESWNGMNQRGESLPSGIYFARLVIDGKMRLTRKLVLLR